MKKKIGVVMFSLILLIALLTPMAAMAAPPYEQIDAGWFTCITTGGNFWTALECVRWAIAHGVFEINFVTW